MPRLSEEEKQWRAESDANTLAEAEVIRNDSARFKAAKAAAAKLTKDAEARADGFRVVSSASTVDGGGRPKV